MENLKIKYLFNPIAILFISASIAIILSRMPNLLTDNQAVLIIFDLLFVYWASALIFNIIGFLKNRIPVNKH